MDNELGYRLSRAVVGDVAPEQLPDFDEDWQLWLTNPKALAASRRKQDSAFDQALAEAVISGIAAGAVKAALDFLAERLSGRVARGFLGRLRPRRRPEPVTAAQVPRLSEQDIDGACAQAVSAARRGGASDEVAESVGAAVRRQLELLAGEPVG